MRKNLEGFFSMRRYALRYDQWDRIKLLLPGSADYVGVTAKDRSSFIPLPGRRTLVRPS